MHGTLHFLYLSHTPIVWNMCENLPIVWNMCENRRYGSVYFKELHNEQECYSPTIYRAGAAVVSTITSFK